MCEVTAAKIEIYGKPDCCLCDEAKAVIEGVGREPGTPRLEVTVVDISRDDALLARYGHEIPVVFMDGRKAFKHRVDAAELRRRLERGRRGSP